MVSNTRNLQVKLKKLRNKKVLRVIDSSCFDLGSRAYLVGGVLRNLFVKNGSRFSAISLCSSGDEIKVADIDEEILRESLTQHTDDPDAASGKVHLTVGCL